jgi:hypothetical protein
MFSSSLHIIELPITYDEFVSQRKATTFVELSEGWKFIFGEPLLDS